MICDNLSAHKAPVVQRRLLAHSRVQMHVTPTYSSWLSQDGASPIKWTKTADQAIDRICRYCSRSGLLRFTQQGRAHPMIVDKKRCQTALNVHDLRVAFC